eukprot:Clim_evm1s190 gene=Clim_evmTU1s190
MSILIMIAKVSMSAPNMLAKLLRRRPCVMAFGLMVFIFLVLNSTARNRPDTLFSWGTTQGEYKASSTVMFLIFSRPGEFWWREVARRTWLKSFGSQPPVSSKRVEDVEALHVFVIEAIDNIQLSSLERTTLEHEQTLYGDILFSQTDYRGVYNAPNALDIDANPNGSSFKVKLQDAPSHVNRTHWVQEVHSENLLSMPVRAWPLATNLSLFLTENTGAFLAYSSVMARKASALAGPGALGTSNHASSGTEYLYILSGDRNRHNRQESLDSGWRGTLNALKGRLTEDTFTELAEKAHAEALDMDGGNWIYPCSGDDAFVHSDVALDKDVLFLVGCTLQQLPVLASGGARADYHNLIQDLVEVSRTGVARFEDRVVFERMLRHANLSRSLFDIALGDLDKRRVGSRRTPDILGNSRWWNESKGLKAGKRAFLVGNAPSLNRLPLWMLTGEDVLVFNRFYLMQERFYNWTPLMYMCIDSWVCPDVSPDINWYRQFTEYAFFPYTFEDLDYFKSIVPGENTHWFWFGDEHDFSKTESDKPGPMTQPTVGTSGTVASTGMEVLGHLGYESVFIIGVDMTYKADNAEKKKKDGDQWLSKEDDKDHFDSRYFGKGRKLKAPDVQNVMLPSMVLAAEYIETAYDGRTKFTNAGYKGALEVFGRIDFAELFKDVPDDEVKRRFLSQLNPTYTMEVNFAGESLQEILPGTEVVSTVDEVRELDMAILDTDVAVENMYELQKDYVPHGPYNGFTLFVRRPLMPGYVPSVPHIPYAS